jgi:serine/threonine-protein kinase
MNQPSPVTEAAPNTIRFGPYVIQEKLGAGGMAAVYKAFDEERGEEVALKVLHATLAAEAEIVQRFRQEVEIANRLRHAHVVAVYKQGIIKNRPFMVMRYMAGGTLAQRFQQPTEITSQHAVRLMRHIGSALDYAHRQGVVHRDLKLENILLDSRGDAYLSDFGIARIVGATRLTVTGSVVGTPLYISPEQARGKFDLDYRSDLYSLAVIAYVLAVGRFPFDANNILALLNQHLTEPPPLPSEVNPNLAPALDAVLLKGLAKRPEDRYRSADMFIEAYAKAAEDGAPSRAVVDLRAQTNSTGQPALEETGPEIVSADDWYAAAVDAAQRERAIDCLKRALELDPWHSKANRLLMQLEKGKPVSVKPERAAPSIPAPLVEDVQPLKKPKPEQKRSGWNYIGALGAALLLAAIVFFVFALLRMPLVEWIGNLLPR